MQVDELEPVVIDVFRDALKNPKLGPEEDFFAAGGDSLRAVEAIHRLSDAVGEEIDPMIIFMYPTAASFSDAMRDLVASGS